MSLLCIFRVDRNNKKKNPMLWWQHVKQKVVALKSPSSLKGEPAFCIFCIRFPSGCHYSDSLIYARCYLMETIDVSGFRVNALPCCTFILIEGKVLQSLSFPLCSLVAHWLMWPLQCWPPHPSNHHQICLLGSC